MEDPEITKLKENLAAARRMYHCLSFFCVFFLALFGVVHILKEGMPPIDWFQLILFSILSGILTYLVMKLGPKTKKKSND